MAKDEAKWAYWTKQVKDWRSSGLSRNAYCKREGLKPTTFDYWRPLITLVLAESNAVGACLGTGTANVVVAACLKRQCVPLMGNALFNEYEDVFNRDDLFKNCKLSRRERDELLDVLFACCEWTRVYYLWRPNLLDEADNHLVELAVAGGADFIVTRNLRHLRNAQLRFPEIRIASPGTFLKEI